MDKQPILPEKSFIKDSKGLMKRKEGQLINSYTMHYVQGIDRKRNKGRSRLHRIENINEDITKLGLSTRTAPDLTKV